MRVCLDGQFLDEEKASIPVSNRGFLFGDGVFRTMCVKDGVIGSYEDHIERLKSDCLSLKLEMPQIEAETFKELVRQNSALEGLWRLKCLVSAAERKTALTLAKTSWLITLQSFEKKKEPLTIALYPYPMERAFAFIKTLSYADMLAVERYASEKGVDDALVISHQGCILETSKANLLWIEEGELNVVDPALPYLEGVTQKGLLKLAAQSGFKINQRKLKAADLPKEAHIYSCNTMQGALPVVNLAGRAFSRNLPFEAKLQEWSQKLHIGLSCR